VKDRDEALTNARKFADSAFIAAVDANGRSFQEELVSGTTVRESAKVYGKYIDNVVLARLNALLEGYELHGVQLDHQLAAGILDDVMKRRDFQIHNVGVMSAAISFDPGPVTTDVFTQMVESECTVTRGFVNVQIQRRRLTPKKEASTMNTTYQLIGHASRVNVNSTDNSTNVVEVSEDQIFSQMRQDITTGVPAGEREIILEKLVALEKAQKTPSIALRYAEFIGAAANHMTIIGPFLPALTAMVQQWR
jgi:hypothetical protein